MQRNNKQLKVLILTHTYSDSELGGEPKIVYETSNALSKQGVNVYVVASRVNISQPINKENLKVYQAPFCKQISVFEQGNMLKVFLFSLPLIFFKRIQLIHLMAEPGPCPFVRFKVKPLIFSSDISWDYANPKYGSDLNYDRQNKREEKGLYVSNNIFVKFFDKIVNWFYILFRLKEVYPREIDLYMCTSNKLIKKLVDDGYVSIISLVQWGVNTEKFNPNVKPFKRKNDKLTFLFIGTLSKRKGTEYLIKAFLKLNQKYENIELLLVGDGAESTIQFLKRIAMNSDNIEFIGPIPPINVPNYFVYADVFVLPSLGEPFGLVNLEAMACGKSVISTNAGGVPDYFRDKEIGFLVEPANVDDLEEAMEKFVLDSSLSIKMGRYAYQYVINNYTWDDTARKIIDNYKLLLKKNGKTS